MQTIFIIELLTASYRPEFKNWQLLYGTVPVGIIDENGLNITTDGRPIAFNLYQVENISEIMKKIYSQYRKL